MARKKMTAAEKKAFVERMKKGRAAAKRKSPAKRKAPAKRKTTSKRKTPAKKNPVRRTARTQPHYASHVLRIETTKNEIGYLSGWTRGGAQYDTDMSKAKVFVGKFDAELVAHAIVSTKPKGIRSVEVVKK